MGGGVVAGVVETPFNQQLMPSYLDIDPARKTGWRFQRAVPKNLQIVLGKRPFVK
jgi:hypothetical protein